jgi:hypothetical protein
MCRHIFEQSEPYKFHIVIRSNKAGKTPKERESNQMQAV